MGKAIAFFSGFPVKVCQLQIFFLMENMKTQQSKKSRLAYLRGGTNDHYSFGLCQLQDRGNQSWSLTSVVASGVPMMVIGRIMCVHCVPTVEASVNGVAKLPLWTGARGAGVVSDDAIEKIWRRRSITGLTLLFAVTGGSLFLLRFLWPMPINSLSFWLEKFRDFGSLGRHMA